MKISVANPIYDSVFKFLMDDERIAKTVLSALLKKEVLSVECASTNILISLAINYPCLE